jgi:mono/diheme cytochrome c family protein
MKKLARQLSVTGVVGILLTAAVVALLIGGAGCKPTTVDEAAIDAEEHQQDQEQQQEDEHEAVPAEYASLVNPVAAGDESVKAGGAVYEEYCVGCHGASGKGDGPKAAELDHTPANFTDPHMADEMTDAGLFWRVTEGNRDEDMPSFKNKLEDEQRWQVVNFLRTFAPTGLEHAAYQCPMHPDQTSDSPGECAVCGMDLQPVDSDDADPVDEHAGHDHG